MNVPPFDVEAPLVPPRRPHRRLVHGTRLGLLQSQLHNIQLPTLETTPHIKINKKTLQPVIESTTCTTRWPTVRTKRTKSSTSSLLTPSCYFSFFVNIFKLKNLINNQARWQYGGRLIFQAAPITYRCRDELFVLSVVVEQVARPGRSKFGRHELQVQVDFREQVRALTWTTIKQSFKIFYK